MASKHGSKTRRNKKYVPKRTAEENRAAMYVAVRDSWRKTFRATQEEATNAELVARFAMPLSPEYRNEIHFDQRRAVAALFGAGGDMEEWNCMVEVLSTTLVLCERGFGKEYVSRVAEANEFAYRAKLHRDATGEWGWNDAAQDAINEAIDVHGAQLEHILQADILSAYAEVARRIEQQQVYKEAA